MKYFELYKLIAFLNHLLTATNQHGVHSPFVYDYITKCLYAKSNFKGSRTEKVLLKSIPYFSTKKVKIISSNPQIKNRVQKELGLKTCEEDPIDLIYLEKYQVEFLKGDYLLEKAFGDSGLLFRREVK